MPIDQSKVVIGGVYATASNQERKVVDILPGDLVKFDARSPNSGKWTPHSVLGKEPSREKFASECERVVSLPKP